MKLIFIMTVLLCMNNLAHAKSASKSTAENSCYGLKDDKFFGKPIDLDIAILASIIFPKDLAVKKAMEEQIEVIVAEINQAAFSKARSENFNAFKLDNDIYGALINSRKNQQGQRDQDILSKLEKYSDKAFKIISYIFMQSPQLKIALFDNILLYTDNAQKFAVVVATVLNNKAKLCLAAINKSQIKQGMDLLTDNPIDGDIEMIELPVENIEDLKKLADILTANKLVDTSKEEAIQNASAEFDAAKRAFEDAQAEFDAAKEAERFLERSVSEKQNLRNKLSDEHKAAKEKVTAAGAQVTEKQEAQQQAEDALNEKKRQITVELEPEIKIEKALFAQTQKATAELMASINANKTDEILSQMKVKVQNLTQGLLTPQRQKITEIQNTAQTEKENLARVKQELATAKQALTTAKQALTTAEKELETQKQELATAAQDTQAAQDKRDAAAQAGAQASARLAAAEQAVQALQIN